MSTTILGDVSRGSQIWLGLGWHIHCHTTLTSTVVCTQRLNSRKCAKRSSHGAKPYLHIKACQKTDPLKRLTRTPPRTHGHKNTLSPSKHIIHRQVHTQGFKQTLCACDRCESEHKSCDGNCAHFYASTTRAHFAWRISKANLTPTPKPPHTQVH